MSGQGEPDRQDAPAARRNVAPIGDVLQGCLPASGLVLEIASGSGQHACAFGTRFPALTFQPSDPDARSRASISAWIAESGTSNVAAPLDIDVMAPRWWMNAGERPAAMMAINMIHISPWQASEGLMAGAGSQLSVAVGSPGAGTASHSTVTSIGTPLRTGSVVSSTVIVCTWLLLLPQRSVAVHVRVSV